MRLSLTRQLKCNLGNYESYTFGATVTVEHGDLGYTDQDWQSLSKGPDLLDQETQAMRELAEVWLDRLLIADIESTQAITEEDRSVVLRAFTKAATSPTPRSYRGTRKPSNRPSSRRSHDSSADPYV